jgi:hypothetical protein
MLFKRLICTAQLLFVAHLSFSEIIWTEDFNSYSTGTGIIGGSNNIIEFVGDYPVEKWQVDVANCELTASTDFVKLVSSALRFQDLDGWAIFSTEFINCRDYKNIIFKIEVDGSDPDNDDNDSLIVECQLGNLNILSNTILNGIIPNSIIISDTLNTDSLKIIVKVKTDVGNEKINIDNIIVEGEIDNPYKPLISAPVNQVPSKTINRNKVLSQDTILLFNFEVNDHIVSDMDETRVKSLQIKTNVDVVEYFKLSLLEVDGEFIGSTQVINDTVIEFKFQLNEFGILNQDSALVKLYVVMQNSFWDTTLINFSIKDSDSSFQFYDNLNIKVENIEIKSNIHHYEVSSISLQCENNLQETYVTEELKKLRIIDLNLQHDDYLDFCKLKFNLYNHNYIDSLQLFINNEVVEFQRQFDGDNIELSLLSTKTLIPNKINNLCLKCDVNEFYEDSLLIVSSIQIDSTNISFKENSFINYDSSFVVTTHTIVRKQIKNSDIEKILFYNLPSYIILNNDFNFRLEAIDNYDNLVENYNSELTINNQYVSRFQNGIANINDFSFDVLGEVKINVNLNQKEFQSNILNSYSYKEFHDFEEDLSSSVWFGNIDSFVSNEKQLQLNGKSYSSNLKISTLYEKTEDFECSFSMNLGFSPSGTNYLNIYFIDSLNIFNEYWCLRIGETGDDYFRIYYYDGREEFLLGSSNNKFEHNRDYRVKFRYSDSIVKLYVDNQLEIDILKGINFEEFNVFSINPIYSSSSRKDQYRFDNIYIGKHVKDSVKPYVKNIYTNYIDTIYIQFSEAMLADNSRFSIFNFSNYSIDGEKFDDLIYDKVSNTIKLISSKINNSIFKVLIFNLSDLSEENNFIVDTSIVMYKPQISDVQINEVLFMPSPKIGLEELKYIELYNNTDISYNLNNWALRIDDKVEKLKSGEISSNNYKVFKEDSVSIVSNLSEKNNHVYLFAPNGDLIDFLRFDKNMHDEIYKENGGWSLERISNDNIGNLENNWSSSISEMGGTPGKINSIFSLENNDIIKPFIKNYRVINDSIVEFWFSERMKSENLTVNNIQIADVEIDTLFFYLISEKIRVKFHHSLDEGVVYKLYLNDKIVDLTGLQIKDSVFEFGLISETQRDEILLSEILYNPMPNKQRYVELYNNTDKFYDLKYILLSNDGVDFYSSESFVFKPKSYVVLCKDKTQLAIDYSISTNNIIECKLPAFDDKSGKVLVYYQKALNLPSILIDSLHYNEEFHSKLIGNSEGFAIERISFNVATNYKNNWISNIEKPYFGSPGKSNLNNSFKKNSKFSGIDLVNRVFSIDHNMKLEILISSDYVGKKLGIVLYDSQMNFILKLVDSDMVYENYSVFWEGNDINGNRVKPGIYILLFSFVNEKGELKEVRKTCVVR